MRSNSEIDGDIKRGISEHRSSHVVRVSLIEMPEAAPEAVSAPRVLVIEDERDVCELLTEFLADNGFDAVCVESDERAYQVLRQSPPFACIVVDVNLGRGTTGYDVARYARQLAPQAPVIYVSGQTSQASFRANGVAGSLFLPKPFTGAELLHRLRMLVGDNDV